MSDSLIDKGSKQRAGEELPLAKLLPWLRSRIPGLDGEPDVSQFTGGASNWTYRLKFPGHDLILRRAPAGTKAKGAHDMAREYRLQDALKSVYALVPDMCTLCEDREIIGTEFYVMQRIPGIILRRDIPDELNWSADTTRKLCLNALDALIRLHQVDYRSAGLEGLAKGAGYTRRQVEGWSHRYAKARTWNVSKGTKVMRWLSENIPAEEPLSLTHNDFRFDNLILDADEPTRVIGVLDWELATIGNPLMDLGNSLTYWIQDDDSVVAQALRKQPTNAPGMLKRKEVLAYYSEKTGAPVDDFVFYEVFGYFRLAGIIQQIYYRYHHGQTRNPQFRHFWFWVNYLLWRCRKSIRESRRP